MDISTIPQHVRDAFVCAEDERFYTHDGVDYKRTLSAFVNMFIHIYDTNQGGSTITQQLVKNITGRDEGTVRRKLVEIFSALELEKKYTKKQIMELYLNVIALSENCEGVESASQVYFGKSESELDLAEGAALIGITNNPSIYDPYINPEMNKQRQEIILGEMLDQKYITQDQYDKAMAEELVFHNASGEKSGDEDYYSYFEDQVITAVVVTNDDFLAGKSKEDVYAEIKSAVTEINRKLPSFKQIRKIEVRYEKFERTTSKKIQRFKVN